MPKLSEILAKNIDRTIDGVVKADDDAHVFQEIDEYVLTDEVAKQLDRLVEHYLQSIDAASKPGTGHPVNGVWISGYFGSGKSHLLKILAYLLENREVNGKKVSALFLPKVGDQSGDQFLKGNLQRALKAPSRSVLFNIEALADAARKDDETTILHIFEKALNRMMGYYHENRAIAEFERHLAEEGTYETFKKAYREKSGNDWIADRAKAFGLGRSKLVGILAGVRGIAEDDARSLIDHYKSETTLSVESFAQRVNRWIEAQEDPSFRLNFFVDEVGQFIVGNTRLMLNLQTLAEQLATACRGKVWIFVTSQEDLTSVAGDPTREQRNDFSKIHARFFVRITLSSADVQEVIQKRILDKSENGRELLEAFYSRNKDALRTVFSFAGGGKNIQFKDRESFVASYPFQAYQYGLLQESLKGLSLHNAFMGRHVSRGERSMLEIFQDVCRREKERELFSWATFDALFEGIRNTLRTDLLSAINTAEKALDNPLAVRILKVLLLVKYVRDFKATADHLKVLLVPDLETSQSGIAKEIQEALNGLEYQSYVERNGLQYQYLTNEEKDIEAEIKATPVEKSEIRRFVEDIVFRQILKGTKIRVEAVGEDYPFKKAIDEEQPSGPGGSDLTIRVVTPYHPQASDRNTVLNQSAGRKELMLFLNADDRFMRDLTLYFQTDIYARHNLGQDSGSQVHGILREKQHQNSERRDVIIKKLRDLVGSAAVYVLDTKLDSLSSDPALRIGEGFQRLANKAYPRLQCIQIHYTEQSLQRIIFPDDNHSLYGGEATPMDEAQRELWTAIQRKDAQNERSTVSSVLAEFGAGQYGWYPMAILCVLAQLYVRGAIEIREGGSAKEKGEVYDILRKNRNLPTYIIRPAPEIGVDQIKGLKIFHHEFFHEELPGESGKECAETFRKNLADLKSSLETYLKTKASFPFLRVVEAVVETYVGVLNKEWNYPLQSTKELRDNLLSDKKDIVDPITSFMEGSQKEIWLEGRAYVEHHGANLSELGKDDDVEELRRLAALERPYEGMTVKALREIMLKLQKIESEHLTKARLDASNSVGTLVAALEGMPEFSKIDPGERKRLKSKLEGEIIRRIERASAFAEVRDAVTTYGAGLLTEVRKQVAALTHSEKQVAYASNAEKHVHFDGSELRTEADVAAYAQALNKAWSELVRAGKRIGLT